LTTYSITLIPGDGIGPEVTQATRRVLEATAVKFHWEVASVGSKAEEMFGTPLPNYVLDLIKKNKVALKGPVTTPVGSGFRSVNVALRQNLGLYASLRPCKTYPGIASPYKDIDLVIIRENLEDLYCGIEFEVRAAETLRLIELVKDLKGKEVREDSGISLKVISREGSARILRFAFEYARQNRRKKVTAVHKANILKFSDGLFLATAKQIAKDYPKVEFEDMIVDNLAMQLVKKPQQYDVLVAPNLYGDIISDLCAGLVGGLGVAPGVHLGDEIAIFEAVHGSAPKYAGENKVNPMAMMLSGVMMLRHLGEKQSATNLEKAIIEVIREGKNLTYDLKPGAPKDQIATTSQVADAVIEKLKK